MNPPITKEYATQAAEARNKNILAMLATMQNFDPGPYSNNRQQLATVNLVTLILACGRASNLDPGKFHALLHIMLDTLPVLVDRYTAVIVELIKEGYSSANITDEQIVAKLHQHGLANIDAILPSAK